MNVFIRVDASSAMGTGHVMRCLTLAEVLSRNSAQVSFLCREHPGNLISLVEKRGYFVHRLPAGIDLSEDRDRTRSILKGSDRKVDWLIVDHYGLDHAFESAQRPHVSRIMVIDDLADRSHDCDLFLNQNYGIPGGSYDGRVPPSCTKALGTSYALVRSEFIQVRESGRARTGAVRRVLVSLGGSDDANDTAKVLHAFELLKRSDITLDVVVGQVNPHRQEIERLAARIHGCKCHVNIPSLAPLMAEADLAVGAGGITMWERCCAGLPTLAITIAENQTAPIEALSRDGHLVHAGTSSSVTERTLCRDLEFLAAHPEVVRALAMRCRKLVDGRGTDRVVRLLMAEDQPVTLRPAEGRDCRTVFDWRNHPSVLSASFNPRPLRWDVHERWFAETLRAADRSLLIAEVGCRAVGVLRYDFQISEAVVSIYLAPEQTGVGLGPEVLRAGTEWVRENRRTVRRIVARVKPGNDASASAFRKALFTDQNLELHREIEDR